VGRWATGRSLLANRRLEPARSVYSVRQPGRPFVADRDLLKLASCRSRCRVPRRSRGHRRTEEAHQRKEWYVQHPGLSSRRATNGQQGQGRFEELEDRGEQVAEGEAPGEEGESHALWRFFDGNIDSQVARGSAIDEGGLPLKPSSLPGRCGRSHSSAQSGSRGRLPTGPVS